MNNPIFIACLMKWLDSISSHVDNRKPNAAKLEINRFLKYLAILQQNALANQSQMSPMDSVEIGPELEELREH